MYKIEFVAVGPLIFGIVNFKTTVARDAYDD